MTIPMPIAADADPLHYPLIARLFDKHGFAAVTADDPDGWLARPGRTLVVFLEDPVRYRETLDVAVVVPELVRAFAGRFAVGVALPAEARRLAVNYGFRRWPALVMLADGQYVGAVDGLRNWDAYLDEIAALLDAAPSRPPSIGVSVAGEGAGSDACAG
ncbi:MAG: hydrogenase [Burkholderiales bacterium]